MRTGFKRAMNWRVIAVLFCGIPALAGPALAEPELIRDSVTTLRSSNNMFGGISGLHMAADGQSFVAISDRGNFINGALRRANGRITRVEVGDILPILDSKGQPLTGTNTDAEGLAIDASGRIYISFESNSRIMRHASQTSAAEFLPKHPDFVSLQNNSGLEALAIGPDRTIYAIPERSGALDRAFPVYRYHAGSWDKVLNIPRQPPFLMVAADVFDGKLYVLERDFAGLAGFTSRIRRFDLTEPLSNPVTLFQSRGGQFDNLEGLSIWRDATGDIRATVISDDNFNFLQRTQIVEFILR